MRKFLTLIVIMFGLGAMAGCNTIAGIGKDMQAGGKKVEETATKK